MFQPKFKRILTDISGVIYSLLDTFDEALAAGSVNGTKSKSGATRTVTDTNTKIDVSSGKANIAAGSAVNDGVWYPSMSRVAGRMVLCKIDHTTASTAFGFDTNTSGLIIYSIQLDTAISQVCADGAGIALTTTTAISTGNTYQLAAVLRTAGAFWFIKGGAYTYWTLVYTSLAGTAATLYPAFTSRHANCVSSIDNIRIPSVLWLPSPVVSDSFNRVQGAIGTTDGRGHGEANNLLSNMGFETAGAGGADIWASVTETAGDGALADETSLVKSGSHAAKLTSGATFNTLIRMAATVIGGKSYTLTFWSRGDLTNAGRYGVWDATNSAYIVTAVSTGITGSTYTQVSATFLTPATCVSVQVYLWGPSVNGGIAYFDDVEIRETSPINPALTLPAWTGSTYTIYDDLAKNTPTLGSELWDADAAAFTSGTYAWAVYGTNTIANVSNTLQITYVDNATGAYVYLRNAADLSADLTVGVWYLFTVDSSINSGTYKIRAVSPVTTTTTGSLSNTSSATQYLAFRDETGTAYTSPTNMGTGQVLTFDNLSLKPLTLSSLFASVQSGKSDYIADVKVTVTAGTQAGLVLNLDSTSSPANFIIAYHDGTNARLEKCVAGVYTTVISAAATYSAGAVLRVVKQDTSYSFYYNNVQVGSTSTISDAGVISNTLHGLFSTYSGNTLGDFMVWPRGSSNEFSILDSY